MYYYIYNKFINIYNNIYKKIYIKYNYKKINISTPRKICILVS